MANSWGFNALEADAQVLSNEAAELGIERGKADLAKQRYEMILAQRAFESAEDLKQTIAGYPGLSEMMAEDPAAALAKIAEISINKGHIADGAEILNKSANTRKAMEEATKAQFERDKELAERTGAAFENVRSADDWNRAVEALMVEYPGEYEDLSKIAMLPYQKENFDYAKGAEAISRGARTQLAGAQQRQAEAAAKASQANAAESDARRTILIPAQAEAHRAAAARSRKAGVVETKLDYSNITDAKKRIASEYDADDAEIHNIAVELLDRAKDIQQETPSITRTKAMDQAFAEAQAEHRFAGMTPLSKMAGSSAKNPLPLPVSDGEIQSSKLQKNKYYQLRQGNYIWDGKKFVLVEEKK